MAIDEKARSVINRVCADVSFTTWQILYFDQTLTDSDMLRFVLGDELGNIKLLHYDLDKLESKTGLKVVHRQEVDTKSSSGVQKLAVKRSQAHVLVTI